MTTNSRALSAKRLADLLKWHEQHLGLYARVASKTALSPAYVSLVARGLRRNVEIADALRKELEHLLRTRPR